MSDTIQERQNKNKELIIEQLKKTPIVEFACKKFSIGRASYYRWKKEDKKFAEMADQAIVDGSTLINDLAESQLIAAIRERNLGAIIFWLKNHHKTYGTKIEISGKIKTETEKLTEEQQQAIKEALKLSSLIPNDDNQTNNLKEKNYEKDKTK